MRPFNQLMGQMHVAIALAEGGPQGQCPERRPPIRGRSNHRLKPEPRRAGDAYVYAAVGDNKK